MGPATGGEQAAGTSAPAAVAPAKKKRIFSLDGVDVTGKPPPPKVIIPRDRSVEDVANEPLSNFGDQ